MNPRLPGLMPVVSLLAGMLVGPRVGAAAPPRNVDFDRDVRPILSDKCFRCHGPDEKERKAYLRLDTPQGAFTATESGAKPIVPGNVNASEVYRRITSTDAETRMPPKGKPLSETETAILKNWIERGAEYKRHWAFIPPSKPPVPRVAAAEILNPIDAFVLDRLEREGLAPNPIADKATLLRRLALDLIGLPPSLDEVDAFLADSRADAYERAVDRLLDSPHYGERWARVWLDAARYADSDGYEKDKPRFVWAYRDWVIQAFNRNMPYDRFVIAQIAGDLLPGATQEDVVATGFLRNSMINEEGGIDPEQFRMEAMFDRMDAIGKSVLGLTIQCAQCHDHKYDPITQRDYYGMFAFLNNAHEANVAVYSPEESARRSSVLARVRAVESDLKLRHADWSDHLSAWEYKVKALDPAWSVVKPAVEEDSTGGQKYVLKDDGSFLASGYAPTKHTVAMSVKLNAEGVNAVRIELLNDPNLPFGGPGRSIQGTAALSELELQVAPASDPGKAQKLKIQRALADIAIPETPLAAIYDDKSGKKRTIGPVELAIDGKNETAWGIDAGPGRRNLPREAIFFLEKPIDLAGEAILTFRLKQDHGGWNSDDNQNHNLGGFRLSIAKSARQDSVPLPHTIRTIIAREPADRSDSDREELFSFWRTHESEWLEANRAIDKIYSEHPEGVTQLALLERDERRPTRRLERGDFLKPRETVEPSVPAWLAPFPQGAPGNRLGFAMWLVDRGNPVAARSIVNRIWQAHFGIGLAATSEDLGSQSDLPSHPELLNWLAAEFMDKGWDIKYLHKLIVTTATYKRSSQWTKALHAADPANRLLARGPRQRADAETVRDIALAASGLLNPTIGGPSVYPPAPAFLFAPPTSYGPKVWREATGRDRYRRALYTFRFRSVPYPMLQAFDAPNGDFSCVRRVKSNTPLQALAALNEPLFVECARGLAQRVLAGESDTHRRIELAFRLCTSRAPDAEEVSILNQFYDRELKRFASGEADPKPLAEGAPKPPLGKPAACSPAELAAWTALARTLLNLDETITRE